MAGKRKFWDGHTGLRVWYAYMGAVFGNALAKDDALFAPIQATAIIFAAVVITNCIMWTWDAIRLKRRQQVSGDEAVTP